ncbi:MAG: DUF86 domain-containing protein [Phycisphaerales bacterium]
MKDDAVYLGHILEAIARVRRYTQGGRASFTADSLVQDGVVRNLEVIGEATKRLSEATRAGRPEIPWRQIAGMRDVLIHNYMGVDLNEVWNVVERDLGPLEEAARELLASLVDPPQRG